MANSRLPIPDQVRECPILNGLTDDDLEHIVARVRQEDFAAGAEILTEGLKYHGLWVLLEGKCEVLKKGPQKWSKLATLGPGNVFGEMSFFDGVTHSATVKAIAPCKTVRLMHEDFESLRADQPCIAHKITLNLVRILADRLRHMDAWTCELVEKDGDEHRHHEWQQFRSKLYAMKDL